MEADTHAYESFEHSIVACGNSATPENCALSEDNDLHETYKNACTTKGGAFYEPGVDHLYCSSTWRRLNIVAQYQIENFGYCYPKTKQCNKAVEDDSKNVCSNLQCPYCRDAYVSDCLEYLRYYPHYKPTLAKEMEGMLASKTAFNEAECWIPENDAHQCLADTHKFLEDNDSLKAVRDQLQGIAMQVLESCRELGSGTVCAITDSRFADTTMDMKRLCEESTTGQWFTAPSNQIACSTYNESQWHVEAQYDFAMELGFCLAKTESCNAAMVNKAVSTCDDDMVTSEMTSLLGPWKSSSFLCHTTDNTLKDCPGLAHAVAHRSKGTKRGLHWFVTTLWIILIFFILLCIFNEQFRLGITYTLKDWMRGNF
jgi:hypothetical protein